MPKAKSLTILGVRGLRVHERTPPVFRTNKPPEMFMATISIAAVQVVLWIEEQGKHFLGNRPAFWRARAQFRKWQDVFNRAMKRYEKEQKR